MIIFKKKKPVNKSQIMNGRRFKCPRCKGKTARVGIFGKIRGQAVCMRCQKVFVVKIGKDERVKKNAAFGTVLAYVAFAAAIIVVIVNIFL